jgi:hypothetical protein
MILYRTSGPWGSGTDANLTADQVDGNFYDVSTRVQFLELHPPTPIEITSFSATGDKLYIYMSDGSVKGPLTLPTSRWFFRGAWQPLTIYALDDLIVGPDGAAYLVNFNHTSSTTFDPGANDGQGNDYYGLLLKMPSASLPSGGSAGTVLTKQSGNNYDVAWAPVPPIPGGQRGQVLTKFSDATGDADWYSLKISNLFDVGVGILNDGDYLRWSAASGLWVNQPRPIFNVVSASSWAPVVGDEGSFMVLTNGTADTTIVVPNDSTQNFQIGSELHINQDGTGKVTIAGEAGVTILKHASFSNQLLGQYATASIKKTSANTWRLFGLLSSA